MSATPEPTPRTPDSLLNVPNLLSGVRIPLAVAVFACIVHQLWLTALVLFVLATVTDWLDGWWARRYGPLTLVGRNLDPLADKVLVCGTFIYLIPVREAGILPWMVTVVVVRELLVTGIRGVVEATGKKFGADWFGKLKMVLQCEVLIGIFLIRWWHAEGLNPSALEYLEQVLRILLWLMLAATIGSGMQYVVKAIRLMSDANRSGQPG